jgi:hypothetical protein
MTGTVADVADELIDVVGDLTQERQPETEGIPSLFADHLEFHH